MADRFDRLIAETMTERELLDHVVECARAFGWLVHHDRPALTRSGHWVTAIQGHPGFPDLVLVCPPRVVVAELKTERGDLTEHQVHWLETLAQCPGLEVYVWRPRDWLAGHIERVLRRAREAG